jgi:hypothetical protein
MVEVARQRPMSILHPYAVEVYVARDGSDVCLSLTSSKAYCARDRREERVRLELEFSRYETYEDKTSEVYRPKALLAHHGGQGIRKGALALLGMCRLV